MEKLYFHWPMILLVDDNIGRVEFITNLLFRHGYQVKSVMSEDLANEILQEKPALILTYIELEPNLIKAPGVLLVDDVSEEGSTYPHVIYLPHPVDSSILLDRIDKLIGPGAVIE